MICSFIIFSVSFAIVRNIFGRLAERYRTSEKPMPSMNWRKRFKRATKENEDGKKEKLIDIELPKPKDGSSPSSGDPKDGLSDKFDKMKIEKVVEEEKQSSEFSFI